ncbi:MAG: hypothetical protein IKA64_00655 [Clostridia bacterium]|nr:hypothetical protein [Clostridia bacterium]
MKKYVVLFCAIVIGLIIIALIPKNADRISNAVVNVENGDIAFCYTDYSGRASALRIVLFDKNGEKLFSKSTYAAEGYASLGFRDNILFVCCGKSQDITYSFDRAGAEVTPNMTIEEVKKITAFQGWKSSFGKKTYELNGYIYCYEAPTIFKDKSKFTITYGDKVKIIHKSP